MKKINIKMLVEISMISALYVVLTLALTPLSYGDIQFRLSEILMLLVLYKRRYAISMVVGCFVANLFSPVGYVDILFGTLATVVAIIPMLFIKNLGISSLFPSISNGLIVGLELSLVYKLPIPFTMFTVFIGEFVVVTLIGVPLFNSLQKNEGFMKALEAEEIKSKIDVNPILSFNLAILIMCAVFYFKLALREVALDEETIYETLFFYIKDKTYVFSILFIIINLLSLILSIIIKGRFSIIIDMLLTTLFIILFVTLCINYDYSIKPTFYMYLIVPFFMVLSLIYKYSYYKNKTNEIDLI